MGLLKENFYCSLKLDCIKYVLSEYPIQCVVHKQSPINSMFHCDLSLCVCRRAEMDQHKGRAARHKWEIQEINTEYLLRTAAEFCRRDELCH